MSLQTAVDVAFNGPDVLGLRIEGHDFHVRKMFIKQADATTVAEGQILHCARRAPDDRVNYHVEVQDHRLIALKRHVHYSDWSAFLVNVAPPWVGVVDSFLALIAERLTLERPIRLFQMTGLADRIPVEPSGSVPLSTLPWRAIARMR